MNKRKRITMLAALTTAIVVATFLFVPPFPQPQWYHGFADQRAWLGVPNFLDVASNVFFIVVGAVGLSRLPGGVFFDPRESWPFAVFFTGLILTGLASGWYHLAPADARLAGDRLAMTVAFSGFASAVLTERTGLRCGLSTLLALLIAGPASVFYWIATETAGAGDLRAYGLVQFTPMLLIPLLLWLMPARYTRSSDLLAVLTLYGLAMALEWLDGPIFEITGSVSGHTLKHLVAALAGHMLLRHMLLRRLSIHKQ